jgi:hypothetical protein
MSFAAGDRKMRIIRTEEFFETPHVGGQEVYPLAKSVSAAWFKEENWHQSEDFSELLKPGFFLLGKDNEKPVRGFLANCLAAEIGAQPWESKLLEHWTSADELEKAFHFQVIVEQSPPAALSLSSLIAKAPGVAIGTYIGMQIGADHPTIMLLSVPGGILAVSTAIGISKALERGMHKKIEALFNRKAKPPLLKAS